MIAPAADRRDWLEAVIWRTLGKHAAPGRVDAILAAADAYATALATEGLDHFNARKRLAQAAAEYYREAS